MSFRLRRSLTAAVFSLSLAGAPVVASAQDADGMEFSDQQLQAYAEAAIAVTSVIEEWQPRIQDARAEGDEDRAESLIEEANADLVSTIQAADGITLEEYQQISLAARNDQDLYEKLSDRIEHLQQ